MSGPIPAPSGGGFPSSDRTVRSIYVGNIPYEATEEKLREIFEQVGQVVHVRLMCDRETGRAKGYGFIEYQDYETAQSALRNLGNVEFAGRPLRIGLAAGETVHQDIFGGGSGVLAPVTEPTHGPPLENPADAPEAISQAVASLPPEQMHELMKQMKDCVQSNPHEARELLKTNPQLAYALLQAQIMMKIVDSQTAMSILQRPVERPPPPAAPVIVPAPRPANLMMPGSRPPPPPPQMAPQIRGPQHQPPPQDDENSQLLMQVLSLTEAQIMALPEAERNAVLMLKQQVNPS